MRIRTRLLLGFLLVIALSAVTEVYSISVIDRTSALTVELYDRPLMASNFALSATVDFERADRALVVAALAEAGARLRDRASAIAAIEASVLEDLSIVEQRFPHSQGSGLVADVTRLLCDWDTLMKRMVAA